MIAIQQSVIEAVVKRFLVHGNNTINVFSLHGVLQPTAECFWLMAGRGMAQARYRPRPPSTQVKALCVCKDHGVTGLVQEPTEVDGCGAPRTRDKKPCHVDSMGVLINKM